MFTLEEGDREPVSDDDDEYIDDEEIELELIDPLYDTDVITNAAGARDGRTRRRKGRVIQIPLRGHPRVVAMIEAILVRDGHDSVVDLFVVMLRAYCQVYGRFKKSELPSDRELIDRYIKKRDSRYAAPER